MNTWNLLLLISFTFASLSYSKEANDPRQLIEQNGIITVPFDIVSLDHYMIIPIAFGTPKQEISLVVDIGSECTWISKDIFQREKTSTLSEEDYLDAKTQIDFTYKGTESQDHFTIGEGNIKQFDFLTVYSIDGNERFLGAISLGREYDTKKFSFVYRLSSLNIIFYNIFTIQFDKSGMKGELIIGDIPSSIQDREEFIDSCDLITIDSNIKWACQLTHVFLGILPENHHIDAETDKKIFMVSNKQSRVTEINQPAIFETIYNRIYAPLSFIDYLENNYFINPSSKSPICKKKVNNQAVMFSCDMEQKASLKNIHFVFDNKLDLFLTHTELFDCSDFQCNFLIEHNPIFTNWIIGLPILKRYTTIFDYNNPRLRFYGMGYKAVVEMENTKKNSSLSSSFAKVFLILCGFIGSGIVAIISYIYIARRKNSSRKQIEDQIYENL